MSVVLVVFPGAPKVSPEAQKKDAELDQLVEAKITGKQFPDLRLVTNFLLISLSQNYYPKTKNSF